jgi:hypothetical protein
MKKTLGIIIKSIFVLIVASWVILIVVEYFRYQKNEPMLVVLKEETKSYTDGHVYIYHGLGYKSIIYNRTSIYGKEFGPFFIQVKEEIPRK